MQLSVEVRRQNGTDLFLCRGCLVQGQSSDYLLDLLTRSTGRDVLLDLGGVMEFDRVGLQALALSSAFLNAFDRRLALLNACSELLIQLSHFRLALPAAADADSWERSPSTTLSARRATSRS